MAKEPETKESPKRGRGRPPRFGHEMTVRIVRDKFQPMLDREPGPMLDDSALAKKLSKEIGKPVQAKTVQRTVIRAFHEGLVTLAVPGRDEAGAGASFTVERDDALKDAVTEAFPTVKKLQRVMVVKSAAPEATAKEKHAQVGAAMALDFAADPPWKDAAVKAIAISSGRFCHAFVENLPKQYGLDDVTVINLSGSIFKQETLTYAASEVGGDATRDFDAALDSDTLMTLLAHKIWARRLSTEPILGEAAVTDPADREEHLARFGLQAFLAKQARARGAHDAGEARGSDERRAGDDSTLSVISIVGVGCYLAHHRLYRAVTEFRDNRKRYKPESEVDPILAPVARLLRVLAEKSDSVHEKYSVPSPICDIANRFFVISPPYFNGESTAQDQKENGGIVELESPELEYFNKTSEAHTAWAGDGAIPSLEELRKWTIHELVDEVNKRMITVTKSTLSHTDVWLGAASAEKAPGIFELFRGTDPKYVEKPLDLISVLFIDEEARDRLAAMIEAKPLLDAGKRG